jgi:hypothetical protein
MKRFKGSETAWRMEKAASSTMRAFPWTMIPRAVGADPRLATSHFFDPERDHHCVIKGSVKSVQTELLPVSNNSVLSAPQEAPEPVLLVIRQVAGLARDRLRPTG